jgi:hypothetical protein
MHISALGDKRRAEKWDVIFYFQPGQQNPPAKPDEFFLRASFLADTI